MGKNLVTMLHLCVCLYDFNVIASFLSFLPLIYYFLLLFFQIYGFFFTTCYYLHRCICACEHSCVIMCVFLSSISITKWNQISLHRATGIYIVRANQMALNDRLMWTCMGKTLYIIGRHNLTLNSLVLQFCILGS